MGLTKGSSDRQFLFINGRPVDLPKAGALLLGLPVMCVRACLGAVSLLRQSAVVFHTSLAAVQSSASFCQCTVVLEQAA